jgi:hypothetical protein
VADFGLIEHKPKSDSQVLDAVDASRASLASGDTPASVGTAMAYQLVAQATGMMVTDGAAFVSNVTAVNLAAITVATAKFVESQGAEVNWLVVIQMANNTIQEATKVFTAISEAAAGALKDFPSG